MRYTIVCCQERRPKICPKIEKPQARLPGLTGVDTGQHSQHLPVKQHSYGNTHTHTHIIYIHIYGWWFGTCFIFPYLGNFIIPTDEFIFFRGVGIPPTRYIYIYGNPWVYVPYPYFYWRVNGHRMDEWVQSDSMLFRQHIMELFSTWFS